MTLEEVQMNFKKEFSSKPCPTLKTIYNWAHKGIIKFPWGVKIIKSKKKKSSYPEVDEKKNISHRESDFNF